MSTNLASTIRHIHYLNRDGGHAAYPSLSLIGPEDTIEDVIALCANDAREDETAIEITYMDGTTSTHKIVLYIAAADVPAGEAAVFEAVGPAWPAENGWTLQGVVGQRSVLKETYNRKEAMDAVDAWLADEPKDQPSRYAA